jgi:hypothetical protein
MQTLWKAGTVYMSEPGEVSDIGADSLNGMSLGAGVRLLVAARFRGVVIRSPALTLPCSAGSRGMQDACLAFSERNLKGPVNNLARCLDGGQVDLADNRGDVIGRRRAAREGPNRLIDASDEFSRAVLRMAFNELKSFARPKLSLVVVGSLRDPVGQQDEGFTVVQWDGRTGAKRTAGEET